MAKRKLHHIHKIKVHHNRWLAWALAYTAIVAIALVGYLKIADLNIQSEAENVFEPSHSYRDSSLGFGLRYPGEWSIEAGSNYVNFIPSQSSDSGVSVNVVDPSSSTAIRKNLVIKSETDVTLGGVAARKIVNDLGGGHAETVVMATHNKRLYVVRGTDHLLQPILMTFNFVTK